MHDFLRRLRERKLVQWALAYLAGAWVLLQVVGLVGQQFDWPQTLQRGITVAAGVGFFVALVLAWYHGERGVQRVNGTELLIIALLLLIGGALLWRYAPRAESAPVATASASTAKAPAAPDRSIAVLPFANLSDDKANAYFADGIQDEILTKLAKIGALRVVSRTTTKRFAGTSDDMATIAQRLGVAHLLEGSVQKAGNAVHINVQLIRAATDEHLWAESYDRTLENIFGVQGEVAQAVADALKAQLTGAEKKVIAATGTASPTAFEAYLRGRALDQAGYTFSGEIQAVDQYLAAAREDPGFAQAWAAAAVTMSDLYLNGYDTERTTAAAVKDAADHALRAQPELAESLLAQGAYYYRVVRDYPRARELFLDALRRQPGDLDTLAQLFFVERRMGLWDEAEAHYRETLARDPRNVSQRVQGAIEIYFWQQRFDETRAELMRALEIVPEDPTAHACLALVEQYLGRLDAAEGWLAKVPRDSRDYYEREAWIDQLYYRRDYAGLSALAAGVGSHDDAELNEVDWFALVRFGIVARASGHEAEANATFKRLALVLEASPRDHVLGSASVVPLVYAGLGQHERAIAAAKERMTLYRNDALGFGSVRYALAGAYAMQGNRDQAIALLGELLDTPAGHVTPALLRMEPVWDPIRDDPRFVALTNRPIAAYKAPAHG